MRYLSVLDVITIHEYVIQNFGGLKGVLSLPLLESAVYRPHTSFNNKELYDDVFLKTACLLHALIKNHSFLDGNKRTAVLSAILNLNINGYDLVATNNEIVRLALDVESDKIDIPKIAVWLKSKKN